MLWFGFGSVAGGLLYLLWLGLGGLGFCCGWQRFVYSGFAFEFCGLGGVVGVNVVVIVGVMKVFWCLDCGDVGWFGLYWLGLLLDGLFYCGWFWCLWVVIYCGYCPRMTLR